MIERGRTWATVTTLRRRFRVSLKQLDALRVESVDDALKQRALKQFKKLGKMK